MIHDKEPGGALAADTANQIKRDYLSTIKSDHTFLPPERKLSNHYKVSRTTMRRALAQLTQQELIQAEHGRGYRILIKRDLNKKSPRIAILQASKESTRYHGRTGHYLIDAMQRQSLKRKWQVLNIDIDDLSPAEVISELKDANVQAAALVFNDKQVIDALIKEKIICISLENSGREHNIDYIFPDNLSGARKAANYLISKGHNRIAWVGPIKDSFTSFTRHAGARSAMVENDLDFSENDLITDNFNMEKNIHKMLTKKHKPSAILALWSAQAVTVTKIATELKLKIGKDYDLVGWCNQFAYNPLINETFPKKAIPPMIVWSPDELAEVAINRISLHFQETQTTTLHLAVPTKLILPNSKQLSPESTFD